MKNGSDDSGSENADEVPGYAVRTVSELMNLGHEAAVAEVDRMQRRSQAASERAAAA